MDEQSLFLAALDRPTPAQRQAFLDETCGSDTALRDRIETLLKHHEESSSFLEHRPADLQPTEVLSGDTHENSRAARVDERLIIYSDDTADLSFLTPTDKPDCLGTLGCYEVQQVLGRGGMGVVLKAHDTRLQRTVAIKVLAPELAANATARQRFLREARSAAAVTHPHVVTIHAVEESQYPYLVMQCVPGQTLRDKIDAQSALPVEEILRIGSQIAYGLGAAHKQGLIHRDIKPANILLENGQQWVKITDFGLARAMDDIGITQTGEVAGTPQYMSPEQAQGEPVDTRSDLFSLGSVLYTMCTGRSPFRGDHPLAVIRRVIDEEPQPIGQLNPDIPAWLSAVVEKLMAKQPDARYQSAAEVASLLEQRLAELQYPESAVAGRKERTARSLAVAGGLVGILLVLGVVVVRFRQPDGSMWTAILPSGTEVSVSHEETAPETATAAMVPVDTAVLEQFSEPSDISDAPGAGVSSLAEPGVFADCPDPTGGAESMGQLVGHPFRVRDLQFTADGSQLVSISESQAGGDPPQQLRVWDVATQQCLAQADLPIDNVTKLVLLGDHLALLGAEQSKASEASLHLVDLSTMTIVEQFCHGYGVGRGFDATSQGNIVVYCHDRELVVWNVRERREVSRHSLDQLNWHGKVGSIELAHDDQRVLVSGIGASDRSDDIILDLSSGDVVGQVPGTRFGGQFSTTWSHDDRYLFGLTRNLLRQWDASSGVLLRQWYIQHEFDLGWGEVEALSDHRHVIVGRYDGYIRLLDLDAPGKIAVLEAPLATTTNIAISADGHLLAAGDGFCWTNNGSSFTDAHIRLWRLPAVMPTQPVAPLYQLDDRPLVEMVNKLGGGTAGYGPNTWFSSWIDLPAGPLIVQKVLLDDRPVDDKTLQSLLAVASREMLVLYLKNAAITDRGAEAIAQFPGEFRELGLRGTQITAQGAARLIERFPRTRLSWTATPDTEFVLPTSATRPQLWKFTFDTPADGWYTTRFDDTAWREGAGAFGTSYPESMGVKRRTAWDDQRDIWLRQKFFLDELPQGLLCLHVFYDEVDEIRLNNHVVFHRSSDPPLPRWQSTGTPSGYDTFLLTDTPASLLRTGENVIAVHGRCEEGSKQHGVDVGLIVFPAASNTP